jgi:hypothetical protein
VAAVCLLGIDGLRALLPARGAPLLPAPPTPQNGLWHVQHAFPLLWALEPGGGVLHGLGTLFVTLAAAYGYDYRRVASVCDSVYMLLLFFR